MTLEKPNPAQIAADEAQALIRKAIDGGSHFLVEAGAGAGKTYSLVEALKHVILQRGTELTRKGQQVACITYTKVATEEIRSELVEHPAVLVSTIHSFCWRVIGGFQAQMRSALPEFEVWKEKIEVAGGIGSRQVTYDEMGRREVTDTKLSLHHDDVLLLMAKFLERPKFRMLLAARHPLIFIDEYQDTDKNLALALKMYVLTESQLPVGFFGDHWQKIYGNGCGRLEHENLQVIPKGANFRSAPPIVKALNRIRPELKQEVRDPDLKGDVAVFHTNDWVGTRQTGQHWAGDLPTDTARKYLHGLMNKLELQGWNLSPGVTKVLMLTHRLLANEQGYSKLAAVFPFNDAYVKKEDAYIAFFADYVEPMIRAYESKQYGQMFDAIGMHTPRIRSHAEKRLWAADLEELSQMRKKGTIGEVIDLIHRTQKPRFTEAVEAREQHLKNPDAADEDLKERLNRWRNLKSVPYLEMVHVADFIDEHTPFATKHSVKGAQFENVLVVFGRGWNHYNFGKFLETKGALPVAPAEVEAYERNRNLFYVACSRPVKRLALLFTQQLSTPALTTLSSWFGEESVQSLGKL